MDFVRGAKQVGKRALQSNVGRQVQEVGKKIVNSLLNTALQRGQREVEQGTQRLIKKIQGNGLSLAGGHYKTKKKVGRRAKISRHYLR